jgi:hypothetical protein
MTIKQKILGNSNTPSDAIVRLHEMKQKGTGSWWDKLRVIEDGEEDG